MDTSEKYIKLCEMAEEVQAAFKPGEGDFICNTFSSNSRGDGLVNHIYVNYKYQPKDDSPDWYLSFDKRDRNYKDLKTHNMFLPRQDQLQSLSGLSWQDFDRECLKHDSPTKEQAGLKVVIKILEKKKKIGC